MVLINRSVEIYVLNSYISELREKYMSLFDILREGGDNFKVLTANQEVIFRKINKRFKHDSKEADGDKLSCLDHKVTQN